MFVGLARIDVVIVGAIHEGLKIVGIANGDREGITPVSISEDRMVD